MKVGDESEGVAKVGDDLKIRRGASAGCGMKSRRFFFGIEVCFAIKVVSWGLLS